MDPFKYINSLSIFGSKGGYKPGLDRIKKLLEYLGNPHHNLNIIQIAGTNGKGSTAAALERIYREAGYKTALYTSPHFFHFNERIKINGRPCSTYELHNLVEEIKNAAVKVENDGYEQPSFFEIVTAIAFLYFSYQKAEIVILETGLGGRLDATNVSKKTLLSIITNISLEHTDILGDNIFDIAAEKAGIIKENSLVITDISQKEALNVIKEKTKEKKSKLFSLADEFEIIKSESNLTNNTLFLKRKQEKSDKYCLSLLGKHQARNMALAVLAVDKLDAKFPVEKKALKKALKNIYWPGRMQKLLDKPLTFVDAAHNPAAFKELYFNIYNNNNQFNQIHLIFSVLADKDINKMLEVFNNLKTKTQLYLAENLSFRKMKIEKLKKAAEINAFNYTEYQNVAAAAASALNKAQKDDLIIAAGSFNTVFEAGIEIMSNKFRGGEYEE